MQYINVPMLKAIYPFNASSSFSLKYAIQKFKELHGAYALIQDYKQRMIFEDDSTESYWSFIIIFSISRI